PRGLRQSVYCLSAFMLPQLETLHIESVLLSGEKGSCDHQLFQFNPNLLQELTIQSLYGLGQSAARDAGLVELLKRTPRIKSLNLDTFNSSFSLPDDLIPELQTFSGRAEMVLHVCRGRPVRNLRTQPSQSWINVNNTPNLVCPGSVPLQHLSISRVIWEDDTMEYIARRAPELISLEIRSGRENGKLSTRYHMPQLRRATFLSVNGPWYGDGPKGNKAENEARLLRDSRDFWPELEYLRLDPNYFWRYSSSDGSWAHVKEVQWNE
ncbi:hypothetical protein FRC01_010627, partial [Tulasnella sp. 417]